tara:strand:+ start:448 stop:621 length:174 start_codon:yes stop_codon:yes gene_type:complete
MSLYISIGNSIGASTDLSSIFIDLTVLAFEQRVLADGGVFEAEQCLVDTLTALNNIE